jgi:hypothetical protein
VDEVGAEWAQEFAAQQPDEGYQTDIAFLGAKKKKKKSALERTRPEGITESGGTFL